MAAILCAYALPGLSQTQTADLEYYVQPDYQGTNSLTVTTSGLSLVNDLAGVTLTFNTSGAFASEFVSQSAIDFVATIDAAVPAFAAGVPTTPAELAVTGGSLEITTPFGEVIRAEISDQSVLRVVPYALAPRVLFYELTLLPTSTTVSPASSVQLDLVEIKTWGLLITNGQTFQGALGFGQNQQYRGTASF